MSKEEKKKKRKPEMDLEGWFDFTDLILKLYIMCSQRKISKSSLPHTHTSDFQDYRALTE